LVMKVPNNERKLENRRRLIERWAQARALPSSASEALAAAGA